jgi:hypothetical protein
MLKHFSGRLQERLPQSSLECRAVRSARACLPAIIQKDVELPVCC